MHSRAANLVLQTPFSTMRTTGTFALRSPIFFKLKIFTGVSFTAVAEKLEAAGFVNAHVVEKEKNFCALAARP